jgi:ribosomal protein S18 acetylase RimI-like enzyme
VTYGLVEMHIRRSRHEDKEPIGAMLAATDVFRPEEIEVALELVDVFLDKPNQKDYDMYSAVGDADEVLGYLCVGPTPVTAGTYDLYWIAVHPSAQRHGVGKALLEFCEELVRLQGGRLIVAETSSQPKYLKTRTFYLHNGYLEAATLKDYYNVGDDLVIYAKYLRQQEDTQHHIGG